MPDQTDRTKGNYHPELELMKPAEREEYQSRRLREIVEHAYANAPAMRDKFDQVGVKPKDIRALKDLERLPITEKTELVDLQRKNPPFGGLVAVPLKELGRIFASPGPIYEPYELHLDDERWCQAFYAGGFRPGDIGQVTFSYHMVPFAMMLDDSLRKMGCLAVPTGVGNTELQVEIMRDVGVNAYLGTPSFLKAMADKAEAMGLDLQKDINLNVGFVAAEMLPETLRDQLEIRFGMLIRQSYGTADVGCLGYECYQMTGMHWPDNVIVEVVDPETGKQLGPGEVGEVVATVFNKTYPLVRFGSGDLSYYTDEPCPCGRTANRLVKIVGRVDQVTKVKGMFIHPGQADELARRFPAVDRYQVVVTRAEHKDYLAFHAELAEEFPEKDRPALREEMERAMPQVLRLRGEVIFLPRGTLKGEYKKIDDRRTWE
ncbi:MAG: AMP-binding protein [Thermodesulfobacteriota bacterium]